jgi:acetoin utilization deacetylase AcuC-like enzyme
MKIKIIFSPRSLEYYSPGHPESPERVEKSAQFLMRKKGLEFIEPMPVGEIVILSVHDKELVGRVKQGNFFELDTPNLPGIFDYARLAVGAAALAAELGLKGQKSFSLLRPPGHHAGKNELGGFCYFNNIAIAVERIIKRAGKIAIVDFDCHHGNGTEEIFLGRPEVIYVSVHQQGIYPGTGLKSIQNCFNFPLTGDSRPSEYLAIFSEALEKIKEFQPNLIAVSAGFDGYKNDPIGGLKLELETYREIGRRLNQLNLPLFAVLEGGYSRDLPECIYNFLIGLDK